MSDPGTPTFDQLRIFLTVVDEGSFASAGRRLNRAVSVISYGIANLEAQPGVILFEREGTRRPKLTEAGRAVLAETRSVASGIGGLKAKVKGLLDGLEAEVNFAFEVMLPARRLGEVLRAFAAIYPTVTLRLHVEALGGVAAHVLDGCAVIGLSGPPAAGIDGIGSVAAGSVPMVPVAAPDHPLACYKLILWANLFLLFWLSLVPFVIRWLDDSGFAPGATAAYGIVLGLASFGYAMTERSIIACNGPESPVGRAIGSDWKGFGSIAIYIIAVPLAYVSRWLALVLYLVVILL